MMISKDDLLNLIDTLDYCIKHTKQEDKEPIWSKRYIAQYKDGIQIDNFDNIKHAAEVLKIHRSMISQQMSGTIKLARGYSFKWKTI